MMPDWQYFGQAILNLIPNAVFVIDDGVITEWSDSRPQPTSDEIASEIARLKGKAELKAFEDAAYELLDSQAKARAYDDAASCISYYNSNIASWASDAAALIAFRDAMWTHLIAHQGDVPRPTVDEVIASLKTLPEYPGW